MSLRRRARKAWQAGASQVSVRLGRIGAGDSDLLLRPAVCLCLLCLVFALPGAAQSTPSLQNRGTSAEAEKPADQSAFTPGSTTLPEAAFGAYALGDPGNEIQLIFTATEEDAGKGRLTGYVSQIRGNTPLTFFFAQSTISGTQVTFATRELHSTSYRFKGEMATAPSSARGRGRVSPARRACVRRPRPWHRADAKGQSAPGAGEDGQR